MNIPTDHPNKTPMRHNNSPFLFVRRTLTGIAGAACLVLLNAAVAQAPATPPAWDGPTVDTVWLEEPTRGTGAMAAPGRSAVDQAQDLLVSRQLEPGFNRNTGLFVAIGSSAIGANCGDEGFADSREQAFLMAMLDAKRQLAQFIAAQVATEAEQSLRQSSASESTTPQTARNPGAVPAELVQRALRMTEPAPGIDIDPATNQKDPPPAPVQRQRKLLMEQSFKDRLAVVALAEVAGLQAYRTFESTGPKGGEVAVIAAYSRSSGDLARSLLGKGPAPKGVRGVSIPQWARSLSTDQLLYTHGAQLRVDENGDVVLVSFGMSTPAFDSPMLNKQARDDARNEAFRAARLFLGSLIEDLESSTRGEDAKVHSDEVTKVSNTSERALRIRARADALDLKGGSSVHGWHAQHPCMKQGAETFGCVMKFSLRDAQAANELADLFRAAKGWEGGNGVTTRTPRQPQGVSGGTPATGAAGELDPGAATRGGAGVRGVD